MNYHSPVTVDIRGTSSAIWYRSCSSLRSRWKLAFAAKWKFLAYAGLAGYVPSSMRRRRSSHFFSSTVRQMRGFLINKNMSLYYWLRKRIGKTFAFRIANTIEKVILIFGREPMPHGKVNLYKRVKQLHLIFSIKKSILIWKFFNSTHLMR